MELGQIGGRAESLKMIIRGPADCRLGRYGIPLNMSGSGTGIGQATRVFDSIAKAVLNGEKQQRAKGVGRIKKKKQQNWGIFVHNFSDAGIQKKF